MSENTKPDTPKEDAASPEEPTPQPESPQGDPQPQQSQSSQPPESQADPQPLPDQEYASPSASGPDASYTPPPQPQYANYAPQQDYSYTTASTTPPSTPPGYQYAQQQPYTQQPYAQQQYVPPQTSSRTAGIGSAHKDKWVAAVLAFCLGMFGLHKFYLGYKNEGIIMLVVSLVGGICLLGLGFFVMTVIAYIEAVKYVILTQEDFERTYVVGSKGWF